ncbi:MAG: hypothetical protein RJA22_708 [Verrucomicrobiota bacterium]
MPLVELRTTHHARFVSDNAGVMAFDLPELMGRETWFDVVGHGYEVARDGFGYRGVRLTPRPGATLRVEVTRTVPARRLGRLTGAGLFAESQKLGLETGWPETGILGCDSIQAAVYQGRRFWFWGDTTLARYPLGIFHMSGATTAERPLAAWEPPLRLRLDVFTNAAGAPRGVAPMSGEGPTWLTGLATVPDRHGRVRMVAHFMKIQPPMEVYQWGQCVWDDATASFAPLRVLWTRSDQAPKPPPVPEGHPVSWRDAAGKEWLLFGNPLPRLRCPATFEAWQDPATWEPLTPAADLAAAGGGRRVKPHSGSLAWSSFRGRWVTVFMEHFGKPSAFGELWYAEAPVPTGPWGPALKVVTHENYTFYNPRLHAELTPTNSPVLLFEGTYTQQFADKPAPTPRHDYNQILYRLDLDSAAVTGLGGGRGE